MAQWDHSINDKSSQVAVSGEVGVFPVSTSTKDRGSLD